MAAVIRRLAQEEVPNNSLVLGLYDVHIPHHDERVLKMVVECAEREGVTHTFLMGDIADCGPASRHPKKKRREELDVGSLRESIAPGLWLYEWARTRPCIYVLGNHEAWVEDYIEASSELRGSTAVSLMGLWEDGDGWEVLPNRSRIVYGRRCWEHGNRLFPTGGGGEHPYATIKKKSPLRTTSIGHLHREFDVPWTVLTDRDTPETHRAIGVGHLSIPESHEDYAPDANWQQSAELTTVKIINGKPQFETELLRIKRDEKNRPYFIHKGVLYK